MSWEKEQMLRVVANEIELVDIMMNSNIPISLVDEKGYFVMVNKAWEEITGFTRKELCRIPFKFFLHKEDFMETMKVYYESELFNKEAEPVHGFVNRYRTSEDGKYAKFRWLGFGMGDNGFSVAAAEFLGYEFE